MHAATELTRPLSRRQVLAGAGAAAFGAIVLPGCGGHDTSRSTDRTGGKPRRGGVLTFASASSSASEKLDPQQQDGPSKSLRNAAVFDTLTALVADGWKAEPRLAESWEPSADLMQWRFKLRTGVTFHDGSPLTAKDVVWTLRRVLDAKVGSGSFARLSRTMTPAGIRAIDAHTVAIKLKSPDALLPLAFAEPSTCIVKNGQEKFTVDTYIGTGPFKLVSFKPGQSMEFERYDGYWDSELPYLDGIRRVDAPDAAVAGEGVRSGSFDVAAVVSYAAARQLGGSSNVQVIRLRNVTCFALVMDSTQKPFDDNRVRSAFKLAIDRKAVLNTVFAGFGELTGDLMMAPSDAYYPDGLPVPAHDPEEAKSLLAAAGHGDGIDVDLWSYGEYTPIAEVFAATAKSSGIRARLRQGNPDTYFDVIYLKNRFYSTDWQQFYPGDLLWYCYGSKATYNESKVKVPEIDALYDKALKTTDVDQQRILIKQGLALAARNMGHIIPVEGDQLLLAKKRVKGITAAPAYKYDLRRAYLEA